MRIITILILVLIFSGKIFSKDVNGTIILKNDSVINVTLKIPNEFLSSDIDFTRIQKGIKYYVSDRLIKKIKPKQLKEIRFNIDSNEYRFISIVLKYPPPFAFKKHLILLIKAEGKMNHYLYHKKVRTSTYNPGMAGGGITYNGPPMYYEYNVLQINGGDLFVPDWFNFFKNICKYISDCPQLVKKINNDTYDERNIKEIVSEYNNCNE